MSKTTPSDIQLSTEALNNLVNNNAPNNGQNFIFSDISLISDNSLYRKNMPLLQPYRIMNPEVILVTQWEAQYSVNYVNYNLSRGVLFLVPIGTIFHVRKRSEDFKLKVIDFHLLQNNKLNLFTLRLDNMKLPEPDFSRINHYYELIHECYESHMEKRSSVEFILLALLHDISGIRAQNSQQASPLKRDEQLLAEFLKLLMQDYESMPRNISYYADKLNLNANSLGNVVKKVSGLSPLNWINKVAMDIAKAMLINENVSMNDIAFKLGFTEQASFSRFFKKETGQSPLDYRRQQLEAMLQQG